MFGLLGDCENSRIIFMLRERLMVLLVDFEAVAVKAIMWTSGRRLDISPRLANSRRKESTLHVK